MLCNIIFNGTQVPCSCIYLDYDGAFHLVSIRVSNMQYLFEQWDIEWGWHEQNRMKRGNGDWSIDPFGLIATKESHFLLDLVGNIDKMLQQHYGFLAYFSNSMWQFITNNNFYLHHLSFVLQVTSDIAVFSQDFYKFLHKIFPFHFWKQNLIYLYINSIAKKVLSHNISNANIWFVHEDHITWRKSNICQRRLSPFKWEFLLYEDKIFIEITILYILD